MEGFCRGCLNSFEDRTELLQYSEERRRLFVYSTGLQVKRNDAFTFQICKECYFSMKTSCKFKKMCRTSDKKIKSYVALKDVDDDLEFHSFLKRNEETIMFRLPSLSGFSTPAHQVAKDDDTESISTSIQNFMCDVLRGEEIPDSEARIIKEVIEEEADVLEDSLDSHWLQDDTSLNDDFPLDVSFSQFSTPHTTNKERMQSPDHRVVTSTDLTPGEDCDNIPINNADQKVADAVDNSYILQNVLGVIEHNGTIKKRCAIDKNLERALKDENNQEIPLEELLASPSAFDVTKSGASTPTIKQILYKDDVNKMKSPKFESDLDILIEKLDKGKTNSGKSGKFDVEKFLSGIINEGKLNSEQVSTKKILDIKQEIGKLFSGKMLDEGFDLSKSNVEQSLKSKLDLDKLNIENLSPGKADMEKLKSNMLKNCIGNRKSAKKKQVNLELENLIVRMTDEKSNLETSNIAKLPLGDESIDTLLKGELNAKKIDIGELRDSKLDSPKIFNGKSCENKLQELASDHAILEEFLNFEKGKLDNIEIKVKNVDKTAQIDNEELTELLQDVYDENIEMTKGKKSLTSKNSIKILSNNVLRPEKKITSPSSNKYCITNFYCKMCSKKFKNLQALKIHFGKFHQYKIITPKAPRSRNIKVCDICGRSFTNTKSLINHLANHENPTEFSCEICTLTFTSENALRTHKSTHMKIKAATAPKEPNPNFICSICGAISSSSSNHLTHLRRHSKSYTVHCVECGSGFYRRSEMVLHMRKHTKEKPFKCPFCEKSFSRRDILNKHMKLHTGEKPYSCQYCGQKFTDNYGVKAHQLKNKNCLKRQEEIAQATEISFG